MRSLPAALTLTEAAFAAMGASAFRDDAHRAELEATEFKGKKVEVSRFKGLGEMNPNQLKETTMNPADGSLIKITLPAQYEDRQPVKNLVERLMGRDPAKRFEFIQNSPAAVDEDAIDAWPTFG
jgi:topoisomerase-4 subunit B